MLELQFFVDGIFADVLEDRVPPRHCIVVLLTHVPLLAQWGESFSKHLWFAIVIVLWLKWAGYLAEAGLNLLAQISDRIIPFGV